MALVMLPCDLPWWDKVKQHLIRIGKIKDPDALINEMEKIYELCNISLDPDDENAEPNLFDNFRKFLENDLTNEERNNFFNRTLPSMVNRALKMKEYKPKGGLHFSLQQQPDFTELEYEFVSSLIANAFFSTFPRRTDKSHPTLRNFNFSNFFESLDLISQKSKLKGILHYFDWLEKKENSMGRMKIMRQVMSGKEWLTIEDWLECSLPLCSVQIKHDGKLERAEANALKICFSSSKIGEQVLSKGASQESINIITFPEILATLLNVEALEDNEVLTIENARHITRISDPKHKATLEKLEYPYTTSICCMDADDYTKLPIGQYEEDNILRELNKCLLAFQQRQSNTNNNSQTPNVQPSNPHKQRRLSPIGESRGSDKQEKRNMVPILTQQSCSTTKSDTCSVIDNNNVCNNRLQVENKNNVDRNVIKKIGANSELVHNRRGRFIVLGSSGECLPVTRRPLETMRTIYSSCSSSDEEFHSAQASLDESEEENFNQKYSIDLDTSEKRHHFVKKLKDALKSEAPPVSSSSSSYDSSFAVGISVTGSGVRDENIKVRREGSTGFALREDSLDEYFLQDSLQQERKWIDKFKNKHSVSNKRESNRSSEYSFSTEYSSELEELYEQFSKWLEDPVLETERGTKKELDNRELAVVKFAGSLLKRTLSESFAGVPVPLTEELAASNAKNNQTKSPNRNKLVLNAKSLSLELARHKHRLAAQLIRHKAPRTKDAPALNNNNTKEPTKTNEKRKVWFVTDCEPMVQTLEDVSVKITLPKASPKNKMSQISRVPSGGLRPIATGNWGCGSSRKGDVQIKVIIQWLAASVAGVPSLIYFTCGHQQMSKLDTVCRILLDRKWCVKDLTKAILKYSNQVLHGREISGNLFQELISHDRSA